MVVEFSKDHKINTEKSAFKGMYQYAFEPLLIPMLRYGSVFVR